MWQVEIEGDSTQAAAEYSEIAVIEQIDIPIRDGGIEAYGPPLKEGVPALTVAAMPERQDFIVPLQYDVAPHL
ncbi:hypothetical protein [Brevundimonas diminuta]|uniref:hypothetical protein n=1 Tax=Brevundimonas diminuta TaxID=293 RepID=UPI0028B21D6E|nr:hypothetical protein [Brevundimonas diminuta]